jgi:hypothetical protein
VEPRDLAPVFTLLMTVFEVHGYKSGSASPPTSAILDVTCLLCLDFLICLVGIYSATCRWHHEIMQMMCSTPHLINK